MKITKTFIGIFLLTFVIGSVSIFLVKSNELPTEDSYTEEIIVETSNVIKSEQNKPQNPEIITYDAAKNFGGAELLDEDYWEKEEKYKFEMLQTGEFHGDEVNAKSGEKWLGLFGKNKEFEIRRTSVNVSLVHDEIVDGKNKKRKTGKKVTVKNKSKPLFLIKNAAVLGEGKVETLFKGVTFNDSDETEGYSTELKSEFTYSYEMGSKSYSLRIERVFNQKLDILYALILESGTTKQILHVSEEDYLGTLYWVGDLDRDNKPDFFLSPWIKENVSESSVFLSSEAERNNLVKKVASIVTTGC